MKSLLKYDVLKPNGISVKLPVIFLHGFYGSKSNLRHIANSPLIHSDRHCYLLDLRNHGDSFHDESMDYNSMTSDIITFMNYVGINKAIWVGHSYGAKIGYYAALQYSSYVSSVIALDIGLSNILSHEYLSKKNNKTCNKQHLLVMNQNYLNLAQCLSYLKPWNQWNGKIGKKLKNS